VLLNERLTCFGPFVGKQGLAETKSFEDGGARRVQCMPDPWLRRIPRGAPSHTCKNIGEAGTGDRTVVQPSLRMCERGGKTGLPDRCILRPRDAVHRAATRYATFAFKQNSIIGIELRYGSCYSSLPQLPQADFFIVMLVEHLRRGQIEVLLGNVHSAFSQRVHACLCTDTFEFCTGATVHLLGDLGQVDAAGQVHGAGVDSEDVSSGFNTGMLLATYAF
jgi:hypothetical protein